MQTHEIKKFRKTYKQYIKPCVFEGYKLAVLFDEKDGVKQFGAKWNAAEETWWIPKGKLANNDGRGPGTVHEWLNGHQMIMGQYGTEADAAYIEQNGTPKMYSLMKNGNTVSVAWYEEYDAVRFNRADTADIASEWMTLEKGRDEWDSLIQGGYSRMHGTHPENIW